MTPWTVLIVIAVIAPAVTVMLWVPRSSPRWWLVAALSIVIPVAGPLLGLMAARVRGSGQLELDLLEQNDDHESRRLDPEHVRRMSELPPLLERMLSPVAEERMTALVTLSHRADEEAITHLRWAIAHGNNQAVLEAALTLDEIELRWQIELDRAREELQNEPSGATSMKVGELLHNGIDSGLIDDPIIVPALAAEAKECFERAAKLDPARTLRARLRQAHLELLAGDPCVALDRLTALRRKHGEPTPPELLALLARARFAVREDGSRHVGFTVFLGGAA